MVCEEPTNKNQAALYRLCNDLNPLHIDPNMSKLAGFDVPILHGLCSMAITTRSVQEHFFKSEPDTLSQVNVRFTSHVFPGETLIVSAWKEKEIIIFTAKTKERKGAVVLVGYMRVGEKAKL